MARTQEKAVTSREVQRLETRQRVFDAAVREFKRVGFANADVSAVVAATGVARGTFYFHFPSKEHVLAELARRAETELAEQLSTNLASMTDLRSALAEVVRGILAEEERLGYALFRDVLNLYFSSAQPDLYDVATHPIARVVSDQLDLARARRDVRPETDVGSTSVFFLIGVYGLLATNRDHSSRRMVLLDQYLDHFCRGLEAPRHRGGTDRSQRLARQ